MADYTLVDQDGNPQNLIVVDDADYPLPEGWSLQDPTVWDESVTPPPVS